MVLIAYMLFQAQPTSVSLACTALSTGRKHKYLAGKMQNALVVVFIAETTQRRRNENKAAYLSRFSRACARALRKSCPPRGFVPIFAYAHSRFDTPCSKESSFTE